MTVASEPKSNKGESRIFDDPAAIVAIAQQSFHKAKRKAIAENDRLGVASYGAVDGKSVVRRPPARPRTSIGPT